MCGFCALACFVGRCAGHGQHAVSSRHIAGRIRDCITASRTGVCGFLLACQVSGRCCGCCTGRGQHPAASPAQLQRIGILADGCPEAPVHMASACIQWQADCCGCCAGRGQRAAASGHHPRHPCGRQGDRTCRDPPQRSQAAQQPQVWAPSPHGQRRSLQQAGLAGRPAGCCMVWSSRNAGLSALGLASAQLHRIAAHEPCWPQRSTWWPAADEVLVCRPPTGAAPSVRRTARAAGRLSAVHLAPAAHATPAAPSAAAAHQAGPCPRDEVLARPLLWRAGPGCPAACMGCSCLAASGPHSKRERPTPVARPRAETWLDVSGARSTAMRSFGWCKRMPLRMTH